VSRQGTIIAYHAVGDCPREDDPRNLFVPAAAFESQMAFLARRRTVLPLEALLRGEGGTHRPAVAITFDDGYKSVLTRAGPILSRHGFPATVFVPTMWIGGRNGWDPPSSCDLAIMNEEELVAAERLGIAVESHGHAHLDMLATSVEEANVDIERSLERLAAVVGRRPRYLAYPFGPSSPAARRAAAAAGLEAAFSIDVPDEGPYARARVQITPLDGVRLFALKTAGRYLAWRHSRLLSAVYSAVRPLARGLLDRR
jgi:peptidoglycan/xylan/chitin deacetylase (PgdA/CDA1 family)